MNKSYPAITLDFPKELHQVKNSLYGEVIHRILSHMLPSNFFEEEKAVERLHAQLPIMCWTPFAEPPFTISFFLYCRFRPNAFRFFSEIINRWLIPGKRLNTLLEFAADFTMQEFSLQKYIIGEVVVRIETNKEYEILQQTLSVLQSEILLGVESHHRAARILEAKGVTTDEKTALIQENIISLIRRRPQDFDNGILSEMQHFLILCTEEFKKERTSLHMTRIICVQYLFRRTLTLSSESFPGRRYINVKLIRSELGGKRSILGIVIGLSYIQDHELFEIRHIVSGIQAIVPQANLVEGSYYRNKRNCDPIYAIYLEIEKEGGISTAEFNRLKKDLAVELKNRFEQRLPSVFMPQNEEVVMRNILTLSNQLNFVHDLPQVIIDFHQQTEEQVEFLVIMARVKKANLPLLASCFANQSTFLNYIPDRKKIVGVLRKKYEKEAHVFFLRMQKKPFLRKDHSVDLYKARLEVALELSRLIGEFRDYNGGTISKEIELFAQLQASLGDEALNHAFLLENYFYSLNPPIMRSILPVGPIKKLFLLIIQEEELTKENPYTIRIQEEENYFFALITSLDSNVRKLISLEEFEEEVTTCFVTQTDYCSFGLLLRNPTQEERKKLRYLLHSVLSIST